VWLYALIGPFAALTDAVNERNAKAAAPMSRRGPRRGGSLVSSQNAADARPLRRRNVPAATGIHRIVRVARNDGNLAIRDYVAIGDGRTVALVGGQPPSPRLNGRQGDSSHAAPRHIGQAGNVRRETIP
jgi:hypothetical protein